MSQTRLLDPHHRPAHIAMLKDDQSTKISSPVRATEHNGPNNQGSSNVPSRYFGHYMKKWQNNKLSKKLLRQCKLGACSDAQATLALNSSSRNAVAKIIKKRHVCTILCYPALIVLIHSSSELQNVTTLANKWKHVLEGEQGLEVCKMLNLCRQDSTNLCHPTWCEFVSFSFFFHARLCTIMWNWWVSTGHFTLWPDPIQHSQGSFVTNCRSETPLFLWGIMPQPREKRTCCVLKDLAWCSFPASSVSAHCSTPHLAPDMSSDSFDCIRLNKDLARLDKLKMMVEVEVSKSGQTVSKMFNSRDLVFIFGPICLSSWSLCHQLLEPGNVIIAWTRHIVAQCRFRAGSPLSFGLLPSPNKTLQSASASCGASSQPQLPFDTDNTA